MAQEMKNDVMQNIQVWTVVCGSWAVVSSCGKYSTPLSPVVSLVVSEQYPAALCGSITIDLVYLTLLHLLHSNVGGQPT